MGLMGADIMMTVEDQFGINIDERNEEKFHKVSDLVEFTWNSLQAPMRIAYPNEDELKTAEFEQRFFIAKQLSKEEVALKIRQIISEVTNIPMGEIKPESRLIEDLGLD